MRLVHEKCGSLEQGVKENQMIVVRISHGLGNQMYQYALLLSLKKYIRTSTLRSIQIIMKRTNPIPGIFWIKFSE